VSALHARPEPARGLAAAARQALANSRALWSEIVRSVWPRQDEAWLVAAEIAFYRRATRLGGPVLAAACFGIAQTFAGSVAPGTRWAWAAAAATVILAAYGAGLHYAKYRMESLSEVRDAAVRQAFLIVAFSFAWCSVGAFFWSPDIPLNHMMLALLLAASLAGSIAMSASHPATAAITLGVYALFMIVPPAFSHTTLDHTIAWLSAAFVALLSAQAVAQYASTKKLLTLEHERSDLVEGLRLAKQESDRERFRALSAGRAKSQFLSNMNHELRTPMNAILGFSELIKQKAFGAAVDKYAEYAEIIHDSGLNLLRLIDDMLDLAKIDGGKLSLRESDVSIAKMMGDLFAENEEKAAAARLTLEKTIPPGLPFVHADERALRQIATNLLSNALKFTSAGGRITLFARLEDDGRVAFGVEDTGIGISPEAQMFVFERFGQGRHDVATADKGTGLGLAIVKGFAEAHDGSVTLESSLGVGTRVTAYLPTERVLALAQRRTG
jgi:two-component system cell cycle sensor histidine kinase PleC